MRVLFTTQPGIGMFHPLVPFARALEAAGHEVTVACADCFRPDVKVTGLVALPAGIDWRNDLMTQSFPDAPPPGPTRMPWINALWRYTTARAMVPDLLAIAERWRPDLFVREGLEYGGYLTAELLGVPHASAGAHWFPLLAPQLVPLDAARSASLPIRRGSSSTAISTWLRCRPAGSRLMRRRHPRRTSSDRHRLAPATAPPGWPTCHPAGRWCT